MTTTPKLDALITFCEFEENEKLAEAYREIREHILLLWSTTKQAPQSEEAARYPSEAETRLIELVEEADMHIDTFANSDTIRKKLAAIKRDLGLA